jgi:hypothetical protein
MRWSKRWLGFLLLLPCFPATLLAAPPAMAPDADPEAWRAAAAWLVLLDSRAYEDSWKQAGRAFQNGISAPAWSRQAAGIREQVGDPQARELIDTHTVTDPTGMPAGEYLRIRYEFKCSRASKVNETVFLVKEPDRGWRVVGYFVQPPASKA